MLRLVLCATVAAITAPTMLYGSEDAPRVEIPSEESSESFSDAAKRIPRLRPDDEGVLGMWRGRRFTPERALLVVWFSSPVETSGDPDISREARDLLENLRPFLKNYPTIDVVVLKPYIPKIRNTMRVGAVWLRDTHSGWRHFDRSKQDRELMLDLIKGNY